MPTPACQQYVCKVKKFEHICVCVGGGGGGVLYNEVQVWSCPGSSVERPSLWTDRRVKHYLRRSVGAQQRMDIIATLQTHNFPAFYKGTNFYVAWLHYIFHCCS